MKHLKLFNDTASYDTWKNSEDYALPNVSYVEEIKGITYDRKKSYILRSKYNATSDNLVAFTGATNIKSLEVNGTSIEFEPIKNETATFDVLGENISLDVVTGAATFPDSYLIKSPASSWSFKAKDPNYTINENTYACAMMMNGETMASPIPLSEVMGQYFTTNDGVTLELVDTFLSEMNAQIQSGMQVGFTLCDVDANSGTIVFIDTEHQIGVTTGGLPTYSFDSEGVYDVEIELINPVISMKFAGTSLTNIEIFDGAPSIGSSAFFDCESLTSVTIGDGVTSIEYSAFGGCSSLTSITIPDSVTSIGEYAFANCTSLTSVYITDIAAWCGIDFGDYDANPLYYAHNLYLNGELVTDLVIPDSVTSIGEWAFYKCSSLTSVTIPDSVTSIGFAAFSGCSSLDSVYITDWDAWCAIPFDTSSGNPLCNGAALYLNGEPVTEYTYPEGTIKVDSRMWCGCTSLTEINLPSTLISIGDSVFSGCSSLTSVTIPDSVTSIGIHAFSGCSSLTSVTIGDSVTSIGNSAFFGCTSLPIEDNVRYADTYLVGVVDKSSYSYTIKESTRFIGSSAFEDCSSLASITIPDSVTSIGNSAFHGCSSLASVTIPDSVTSIGNNAFYDCSSLTSINIPDSVTSIGSSAFAGCSSLKSVTIPDGVTSIGSYAFSGCSSLKSVTIPDSVTSIRSYAFSDCSSLTSITIPDSVTSIGSSAFSVCKSLTSVYCKPTTPPSAGNKMFYFNASGRKIYVPTASVDAYKAASYWSDYTSYIEGYDFENGGSGE